MPDSYDQRRRVDVTLDSDDQEIDSEVRISRVESHYKR